MAKCNPLVENILFGGYNLLYTLRVWITMKQLILLLLTLLLSLSAKEKMRFQYVFSLESESSLNVMQDSDGFLWFTSMFNGLVRYDGSESKEFRAGIGGLSNNFTTHIFEDSRGYIWIGTNFGLNRYNKETNTIIHYFKDENDPKNSLADNTFGLRPNSIIEDKMGNIWFGTYNGLSKYDPNNDKFTSFWNDPNDSNSLSGNDITSLYLADNGDVWVGTKENGITVVNSKDNSFTHIKKSEKGNSIPSNEISAIIKDRSGIVWIGTSNMGLVRYSTILKKFYPTSSLKNSTIDFSSFSIHNLIATNDGKIVIIPKTNALGLLFLDPETESVEQFKHQSQTPFTLVNDNIRNYFEDKSGTAWITHNDGKVYKVEPQSFKFDLYMNDPNDSTSLAANAAFPVSEDNSGNMWIGLWGQGLQHFDRESKTFSLYKHEPGNPKTIPNGYPPGFIQARDGKFYVSTFTGFVEWDVDRREVVDVVVPNSSFYTIIEDKDEDNIFWANGWEMGFNRVNRITVTHWGNLIQQIRYSF